MNIKRSILTVFLLALLTVPAFAAAAPGEFTGDAPAGAGPKADAPEADAPKVTIIYFWGDG